MVCTQANTAHQLAEVYEALGNGGEAAAMRHEVQNKVKDVREVVDDNLAKAAAKSAQAHTKVDELKTQLLAQWHEADRYTAVCLCMCLSVYLSMHVCVCFLVTWAWLLKCLTGLDCSCCTPHF